MTRTIRAGVALSALALAVLAAAQPAAKNNSVTKPTHTVDDGSARKGANSFTEKQARAHIAKSGFSGISALKKDGNGVWRGSVRP